MASQSASAAISIPGYQFSRLLGAGASGQVYLAEFAGQPRAVKIFQINQGDPLQRRVEQEIDILSRLDHPGICAFLDSGQTDQGQLYLAMQYIEGTVLDQYAAEHRLTLDQRIEFILQCADILYYAHQQGVLHRDLKPANILVDDQGQLHILDFGIARVVDAELTRLTMEGQILGTLPYMSPEQIQGEVAQIDQSSDVYSLGIIACELIAGCHPYALHGLSLSETLEHLLTASLKPASAFNPAVPEALDRILAQAVNREKAYRYLSAKALRDDLQRYRDGKPVQARGQPTWQELKQIYRRHRLPVVTALVIVVMATFSAAVSGWFAWQENQSRKQAELQMQKSQSLSQFLIDMLAAADPDLRENNDLTVRELVLNAAGQLHQQLDDPALEASMRCTLGDSLRSLGSYREAREQIEQALQKIETKDSDLDHQCRLALALVESSSGHRDRARGILQTVPFEPGSLAWISAEIEQAFMDQMEGKTEAATTRLQTVLALPDQQLPEDHEKRLTAMHHFADNFREAGQYERAEQEMAKVVKRFGQVYGVAHPRTLYVLNDYGTTLIRLNRLAEAEDIFRRVIEARQSIYGEDDERVITASMNLLNILVGRKKLAEADELSQQLLERVKKTQLLAEKVIQLRAMRGYVLEDLGRIAEAEKLYRDTLVWMASQPDRTILEMMPTRNNLAMLLLNSGRLKESLQQFDTLLNGLAKEYGDSHPYHAIIENNYGEALGQDGQLDKALQRLQHSHRILVESFGEEHPRVIKSAARMERVKSLKINGTPG